VHIGASPNGRKSPSRHECASKKKAVVDVQVRLTVQGWKRSDRVDGLREVIPVDELILRSSLCGRVGSNSHQMTFANVVLRDLCELLASHDRHATMMANDRLREQAASDQHASKLRK
jgi:hypothetical protein